MRHKIARIGLWCCAMAVFTCCASISVNAASTTPPIWYLTDCRNFGFTDDTDDGWYTINGIEYALICPYNSKADFDASGNCNLQTMYWNKVMSDESDPYIAVFDGFAINRGWEPYSYYDFTIDSTWKIYADYFSGGNDLVWLCADKRTATNQYFNLQSGLQSDNAFAGQDRGNIGNYRYWYTGGSINPFQGTKNRFFDIAMLYSGLGSGVAPTLSQTININDLIVSICVDPSTLSNNQSASKTAYARFLLFCPKINIPIGLKFGDIWPIGNVLTPHTSEEENAVNQFSGDKDSIEKVGEVLDTGINSITDFTTSGIGDSDTTNIDLISSLFTNVFPWWFDIFGLMFLFGVLGIVVRRALHD